MKCRKNSLEAKIASLVPEDWQTVDVIALALLNDGEGWSVNEAWYMCRDLSLSDAMEDVRGRWEVWKVNYHSRARVCDIVDTGDGEAIYLDVDCIPFLEIRKVS